MSEPSLKDVVAAVEKLSGEMRAELDALKADVGALKGQLAALALDKEAEVDPETLVMLAAAVTSYLGKRVRIRAARQVAGPLEGAPTWARHGRAAIQVSHQLRRGH